MGSTSHWKFAELRYMETNVIPKSPHWNGQPNGKSNKDTVAWQTLAEQMQIDMAAQGLNIRKYNGCMLTQKWYRTFKEDMKSGKLVIKKVTGPDGKTAPAWVSGMSFETENAKRKEDIAAHDLQKKQIAAVVKSMVKNVNPKPKRSSPAKKAAGTASKSARVPSSGPGRAVKKSTGATRVSSSGAVKKSTKASKTPSPNKKSPKALGAPVKKVPRTFIMDDDSDSAGIVTLQRFKPQYLADPFDNTGAAMKAGNKDTEDDEAMDETMEDAIMEDAMEEDYDLP